jgi:Tol biopolymer transport system component
MTTDLQPSPVSSPRFTRFDRVVWAVVGGALLLTLLLTLWQRGAGLPTFAESENPRILYLGWEEGEDVNQLYVINPDGSGQKRLTDEPLGVSDFAVSPDGTVIAYSAMNEDGSVDLWQMDAAGKRRKRLLACPEATCSKPVWAPDARRLVYERRSIPVPGAPPGTPRLWWLDAQTSETISVFQDNQWLGLGAKISPNGRFLSYISPINQEIQVYDLESGDSLVIPSKTGEPGIWSPDSETLLVSEIQFQGEQFSIHLFSTDLKSAALTNLSGEEMETNDGLPVFSPDGEWLAFGRKKPRAPMGKQLWLMRPDGSDSRAITENADIHYNNPTWSPDGAQLAVQGYALAEPEASPVVWLVDVESGELEKLTAPGLQPVWLP